MTDQPGHERPGDTVPHQNEIEELIDEHVPVMTLTLTAAEIAARWSEDLQLAWIEWPNLASTRIFGFRVRSNTLDQNVNAGSGMAAYLADAESSDINMNASMLIAQKLFVGLADDFGGFDYLSLIDGYTTPTIGYLKDSGAAYILMVGDDVPTSGIITLELFALSL